MITASEFLKWCYVFHLTGSGGGTGPFLTVADNLSDLSNLNTAYQNFGLGGLNKLTLTDSDFIAGSYQLTNPIPNEIDLNCTLGVNTLIMPSAQGAQASGLYQGPEIVNIGTQRVDINNFSSVAQTASFPGDDRQYVLTDNSTTGGVWSDRGVVRGIMGNTGDVTFLQGTNMTIVSNSNGSILFSATGGGGSTTQVAGSYVVNRNITTTVFTGSQSLPPNIDAGSFDVVYQNGVQVTTATISGQTTPIFKNLATGGTRYINIEFDFSAASTGTPQDMVATIVIQKSGGSTVTTVYQQSFFIGTTISPTSCTISGIIPLDTNDYAYLVFTSAGTITVEFNYLNCSGVDTTTASIPSTDALAQGTNNLYLSQDGGVTLENVSGTIISGNMPQFSGTSGVITDSGISLFGNSVLTGTSAAIKFPTVLADGNYLQLPRGNNIGEYGGSVSSFFMGYNVAYDSTAATYKYVNSGPSAFAFEMDPTGFFWKYASSVTGGGTASFITGLFMGVSGILNISSLTASSLVTTDGSNNIISANLTGDVTTSGLVSTLATVNSNVGSFGSATQVGTFTVTATGLITAASNVTISGVSPGGSAGGDLSGTYPSPTVAKINGVSLGSTAATSGNLLIGSGSQWVTQAMSGDGTISSSGVLAVTHSTNTDHVATTSTSTNASFFLLFATSSTNSNQIVNLGTGLTFNPSTNTLTTTTFSGNATTSTTATNATNVSTTATSTNASFFIPLVPLSSTSNQAVSVGTGLLFNPSTNVLSTTGLNLSGLSASMGVATDSSNNLVSVASPLGINAKAFITTATQSLSLQTRYYVSYSGGQMVGTLPLATGSGKTIEIIGLASSSTSGVKINANVADTIQFGSSLGAAGGSATSTAGSATDAMTFIDCQTNIWVIYPALGANITVA